jgi:hypothetical protein
LFSIDELSIFLFRGSCGMELAICEHAKLSGGRCGSPALRGQHYCYFHAGAHRIIPSVNLPRLASDPLPQFIRLADPRMFGESDPGFRGLRSHLSDGALAIQHGYTGLIAGLSHRLLNVRQGKLFLKALNQAAGLRPRTATEDSAVTSNQLQLPIAGGSQAATIWDPREPPSLRLSGCSEARGG